MDILFLAQQSIALHCTVMYCTVIYNTAQSPYIQVTITRLEVVPGTVLHSGPFLGPEGSDSSLPSADPEAVIFPSQS